MHPRARYDTLFPERPAPKHHKSNPRVIPHRGIKAGKGASVRLLLGFEKRYRLAPRSSPQLFIY
jgi:hypothetical protein